MAYVDITSHHASRRLKTGTVKRCGYKYFEMLRGVTRVQLQTMSAPTKQNVLIIGAIGRTGASIVDGLLDSGKFVR